MTKNYWVYHLWVARWFNTTTREYGTPAPGDVYLDYDEWRIW